MKKQKQLKRFSFVLATFAVVFAFGIKIVPAHAVSFIDPGTSLGLTSADLLSTVINIINWALGLLAIVAVSFIIYAGYYWLTSAGNEERITKAKKIITNTVIGLVIILLAWAIVNFVIKTTGDVTGGPGGGSSCVNGESTACADCVDGEWVSNLTKSTCVLPQDTFEIRSITTSCSNPPNYNEDVMLCSAVSVNFNQNVATDNLQSLVETSDAIALKVEQCSDANCTTVSQPSPLFNTPAPTIAYSGSAPTGTKAEFVASGKSLSFVHAQELFPKDTYFKLSIPVSIQGISGKTISACKASDGSAIPGCTLNDAHTAYEWIFHVGTETDSTAPVPTSSYPNYSADKGLYPDRNVNRVPIITLTMNEPIAPWTLTSDNITVTPVTGSVNDDGSGGTLGTKLAGSSYTITANDQGTGFQLALINGTQLDAFTWYEVSTNNLQDMCSNVQSPAPLSWRFETNGVAPGISQFYPSDGFAFACPNTETFVQFNTSMFDVTTGNCSVILNNPQGSGFVTGGALTPQTGRNPINVDPSDAPPVPLPANFNPNNYCRKYSWIPSSSQLGTNTSYSANVTTRYVIDQSGGTLFGNWSFKTTQPGSCANAPYISSVSLPNNQNSGQAGMCMTVIGGYFDSAPNPPNPLGQGPNDSLTFQQPGTNGTTPGVARSWTDANIVTNAPDMSIATYPFSSALQVTVDYGGQIGKLSSTPNNAAQFTYGSTGTYAGPCLYSLNPSSGYLADTYSFSGDHFNTSSTKQIVHFGSTTSCTRTHQSDPACWASDTDGQTKVPNAALLNAYSAVSVENDAGTSNALSYYVTSGEFQVASYAPSCGSNVACLNAAVQANFTDAVQASSVKDTSVTLYSCSKSGCPSDAVLTKLTTSSDIHVSGTLVTFPPAGGFQPNQSYRAVVLGGTTGVQSSAGKILGGLNYDNDNNGTLDSYTWTFATTSSATQCQVDSVQCQPSTSSVTLDSSVSLNGNAFSAADSCNANGEPLNANDYTWAWSLVPASPAYVTVAPTGPQPITTATGALVTPTGTLAEVDAAIPDQNKDAKCTVQVTAKDFTVTDYYPSCGGNVSCTNTQVWAQFSEPVNLSFLSNSTIALYQCQDADVCKNTAITKLRSIPTYSSDKTLINFAPTGGLQPGVWYRAVVSGGASGVQSQRGEQLNNLNFDLNNDITPDSYSWKFGTTTVANSCSAKSVQCQPTSIVLATSGTLQTADLDATVFSAGNACDAQGSELNANDYTWQWSSADVSKVTVAPATPLPTTTATGVAVTDANTPVAVTAALGAPDNISASCSATVSTGNGVCRTDADCVNNPNPPYGEANSCPGSICQNNSCTPVITSLAPTSGAIGSWTTVSGCYFGDFDLAKSKALFLQGAGAADDLPALFPSGSLCPAPTWTERQVIAEVPNRSTEATNDDVNTKGSIEIITASGATVTSPDQFDPHGNIGPNLCVVAPASGQAGVATVTLSGQYFDAPPSGDPGTFYTTHSVTFYNNQSVAGNASIWKSDSSIAGVTVPVYATNNTDGGEITVSTPKGTSNPVAFSVIPYGCSVCAVDNQCAANGATQGCGAQNGSYRCCADRPQVDPVSLQPQNPPLTCRNAMISATFRSAVDPTKLMAMNASSINHSTVTLEKTTNGGTTWTSVTLNDSQFSFPTSSQFMISPGALDQNTQYRVTIHGDGNTNDGTPNGVTSTSAVGMAGDFQWTFTTQDTPTFCAFDHVNVVEPSYLFSSTGTTQPVSALAYDTTGQLLAPIPGVYDWTWQWTSGDASIATVSTSDSATQSIAPVGNGTTTITATAKSGTGWTGTKAGTTTVTVQICLSSWPDPAPYSDTSGSLASQFSTWYCRDQNTGSPFAAVNVTVADGHPVSANGTDDLIRQFFFEYPDENPTTHKKDAVGLLVYENEDQLSPTAWYKKKFGKTANAATSVVAGYQAMRIGTSTYVAGTNLSGGQLYTNIYVLGYNDDAGTAVTNIFNQMLKNFILNIDANDFVYGQTDSVTALQQVQRDTRRVGDIKDYRNALIDYGDKVGTYPTLSAGSYLSALSTSAWPSWTQTFGSDLSAQVPDSAVTRYDPDNTFTPQCSSPYETSTCWDEPDKKFSCGEDSHIYAYQKTTDSRQYDLYANLEYAGTGNWQTGLTDPCVGNPGSQCKCFDYSVQGKVGDPDGNGDTTPPTVPSKVKVTTISSSAIDVTWNASVDVGDSGLQGYTVLRSYSNNASSFASIASIADDGSESYTYHDTNLASGTTYYYEVIANDYAGNESASSSPVSAVTQ